MKDLSRQRCYNHAWREAAARCPECGRYFCRECVTEHEDRVLCAACLMRLTGSKEERVSRVEYLIRAMQFVIGLLILWLFFFMLGQGLLALPTSFHEGAVWQSEYTETG
jgi:hypothetical protein